MGEALTGSLPRQVKSHLERQRCVGSAEVMCSVSQEGNAPRQRPNDPLRKPAVTSKPTPDHLTTHRPRAAVVTAGAFTP